MEISNTLYPYWLDKSHPNYLRWKRSRENSIDRGKFVVSIMEEHIKCSGLKILDLGSGQGGTAKILSENNFVVSIDLSIDRLLVQNNFNNKVLRVNGDALNIPLKSHSFDVIILQDVIEHVSNSNKIISEIHSLLKKNGVIYLSTPNKLSFFNILSDPHWGLPFVSLFKRDFNKKYILKYFRKTEINRDDTAQLFSLKDLIKLFNDKFELKLNTKFSVEKLLKGDKGIVWSDFHLYIIKILKYFKLDNLLKLFANDSYGIINKFFNPTFYFLLKKK